MTGKGDNKTNKVFLIAGKRTPFGKFGGSLMKISPVDLAVAASKSLLEEAKISPESIDHVIMGNVCQSTTDTIYAGRHVGLKLGVPQERPGYTVNRLCGSGIQSILDAWRMIKLGEAQCVLAGGTENMSMIPHLVYGSRFGTKYGALKTVDMLTDSLNDQYTNTPMGITAENLGKKFAITRQQADQFAYESHAKALKAYKDGFLQGEITSIELERGVCDKDENLREDASVEAMASLRSSFIKDGLVSAANASGIVDGAATCLITSEEFVSKNNISPLAEIIDGHVVGVDPTIMGIGPSPAIKQLLDKNSLSLKDIDLFEINEAFAAQVLSCNKDVQIPQENLNIWGGAIALGHPLGASGTRISVTLARQLRELNGKMGIASACIGGGQGISILLRTV